MQSQLGLALLQSLARVEMKLDALLNAKAIPQGGLTEIDKQLLRDMTPKQHATAQMIMRGASNAEIAERLGVTENTAKVHVRLLAKKLGVRNRAQIVSRLQPLFRGVNGDEYRAASGGLPLDWDETFERNPLNNIVRRLHD